MADLEAGSNSGAMIQRVAALLLLLVGGMLSLPLSAYFLDDEGNENYILPAALVGVSVLGFVVGSILPGLAGDTASRRRGGVVGALTGIGMLVIGVLIFFVLLSGFKGA